MVEATDMKNDCPFAFKVQPEGWLYCMRDSQWCWFKSKLFDHTHCHVYKKGVRSA